jgi:hypothetical protein
MASETSFIIQDLNLLSAVILYSTFYPHVLCIISLSGFCIGARGSVVVEALCYKPEGHGFEIRWGELFQFT